MTLHEPRFDISRILKKQSLIYGDLYSGKYCTKKPYLRRVRDVDVIIGLWFVALMRYLSEQWQVCVADLPKGIGALAGQTDPAPHLHSGVFDVVAVSGHATNCKWCTDVER